MLLGCFAFIGGFFMGIKDVPVDIGGETVRLKAVKPWDNLYKRLKRYMGKKIWVVTGIFLTSTDSGYLADIDYGKRGKAGNLRWMKQRKYQKWHPRQMQLPGGKSLAIFVDGVPAKFEEGRFVPIPLKRYMQMLTDTVVMSKRRYPKLMGGLSANAWMWIIIIVGLCLGAVLLFPRFSTMLADV
jgi:hypothetical protein